MGSVIYDAAATLNGFLADEHDSLDWLFAVPGGEEPAEGLTPSGATVLVEGSRTYRWVLEHEGLLEHPERWSEFYGTKPTFVFTTRELPVPAGADVRFVSSAVADALPAIREAAADGDIWLVGGGALAAAFYAAGALDEIAVSIAPALLPTGAPLFPATIPPSRLRLLEARPAGAFARLRYQVLRPA